MTANPNALRPGTVIGGFELVRMLGEGGFGITYEAISPVTRRRYAVKEFFPRGIASRESATRIVYADRDRDVMRWALERFESSTADLCQLRHPNIMEVVHYIKENDTGYMIMEFIEGHTLDDWLTDRGTPPSPRELRPLIEPLFDALSYIHAQGVIHRDIAPDNIMIRPDGRPVVIDFGAMKSPERSRAHGTQSFMVTKRHYAAPEQAEERPPAATLDVYSMAAVLYRALAATPPPDATERTSGLIYRGADPYVPLALAALEPLSQAITDTIDSALSFHAAHRPQTMAAFRDALLWDDAPPVVLPPIQAPAAESEEWPANGFHDQPTPALQEDLERSPQHPEPERAWDDTLDEPDARLDEVADEHADRPLLPDEVAASAPGLDPPANASGRRSQLLVWLRLAVTLAAIAGVLAAISLASGAAALTAMLAAIIGLVLVWRL